ncbi:FMN-binding negative transcriptional regulator [Blastococcus sp. SYSU D00922]
MYVPRFNAMDDGDEIRRLVAAVGSAQLVTVGDDGFPAATLLPVVWDGDRLVMHMARANPHWRTIGDGAPALAVVSGPEAYVSAAWYPSKAEHGRVVPTWNYSAVHLTGRARVHHDPEWLLDAVTRLTDLNEQRRDQPWQVGDAPERFVEKQLKAIVGIEVSVERVEGKAKLSQNRDDADVAGVIAGLRREGAGREHQVADAMVALRTQDEGARRPSS